MAKADRYPSFEALAEVEAENEDYRIVTERRPSRILVLAPHGGGIEPGTSELAKEVAGREHSLYLFEGLKRTGNRSLHITSHKFAEPRCLELLASAETVLAVHGCSGKSRVCVGGLDREFAASLYAAFVKAGLPALLHGHKFPARRQDNICNRGTRGMGAQLEISQDLRAEKYRAAIAMTIRKTLVAV